MHRHMRDAGKGPAMTAMTRIRWIGMTLVMALGCLIGRSATAQPPAALDALGAKVDRQVEGITHSQLKAYGERLRQTIDAMADGRPDAEQIETMRQRVHGFEQLAGDLSDPASGDLADAPVVVYGVPAMSSTKRLPHIHPDDGQLNELIGGIAAQGEYTPLSFVVVPLTDVEQLEVRATDLVGDAGVIAADHVDIKVVKVWYQTGTAWHSYFADSTRRTLVPELLLNDESLIRVDHETQDNYLRVDYPDGPEYVWISAPPEVDDGAFNHHLEPVADSPVLLPVTLEAGDAKQFWITIQVPQQAAAGFYEGSIELLADGAVVTELALPLRVLPFELPAPRTYHDLDQPFYSMMYNTAQLDAHLELNGGDWELAEAKLRAELRNMREHNLYNHLLRGKREMNEAYEPIFVRSLELIKEAGFHPPLFGGFSSSGTFFFSKQANPVGFARYLRDAARAMELIKEYLGHSQVHMFGFDEPSMRILLAQQEGWRELHRLGARIYSTSKDTHYPVVGYAENTANYSGTVSREKSAKWHAVGQQIMNYAGPHTGPENPEFNRRIHGLQLYKAWYDGTGNYKYYDQHKIWNDFASTRFRGFNMVYPTQTGVIDTMAWEAFREGVDDVRYATKLKLLAAEAAQSSDVDVMYAGKKAQLWLELVDERAADLNTIRLEMIHYILDLRQHLGK